MKIFEKRPLALILCIMLGGFSFFIDFDWKIKIAVAAVSLLFIGIIFIFDNLKRCRKAIVIISFIAFSLSLILSAVWSVIFYPTALFDTRSDIKAKVYEIDKSRSETAVIVFKTTKINGKRDRHTFIAYIDKSVSASVKEYDIVSFDADICSFSTHDNGFDGRTYFISQGYSAILENIESIDIHENKPDQIDSFFKAARLKISNILKLRTDYRTGSFLSALLVGDRSTLSGNIRLNFSRLGISHILALSGMHLAILSLALNSVLIKFGVSKKIRVTVLFVLVIIYMALTGLIASVVRSGLTLLISSILYLLSRKADPITSLVIAVSCILIFNPVSCYDLSLWLSAFATLGVIVYSEGIDRPNKDAGKIIKVLYTIKNGCLVSVFAFCATFAFVALKFESFSVISVFSTLLFSFVIQFLIYAGLLLIIFGGVIPFGKIIILFSDLILNIAEEISSVKYIYVSMNSFLVKTLIVLLTVFFFAYLVLEIKNKQKGIIIIVVLLISVFITAEIDTVISMKKEDVILSPDASGDTIILKSSDDITAIYSGKAFTDDGWDVLDTFTSEKLTYIDNLLLSSYSYWTIDFTTIIIDGIKVEKLLIPAPETAEEINIAEGLSYLLSEYGTDLVFYDMLDYISFGDYQFRLFNKVDYAYGKYPENVFEIVLKDKRITYVSACEYDHLPASAKALIFNSDNLIIGSIGNVNYYLFNMHLPDITNVYTYDEGRLTEETTDYYNKNGASVHYTKTPISLLN